MEFWQQIHSARDESFSCHLASAGYVDSDSFSADCARYRHDFQIIYLRRGTGAARLNGAWVPLGEGSLLFYRPMEYQEYRFAPEKDRELFWLYFDHIAEAEVADWFQIPAGNLFFVEDPSEIHAVFRKIMEELSEERQGKALMLSLYTGQLLILLSRCAVPAPIPEKTNARNHEEAVRSVCRDMEIHSASYVKVEEYAARCGLSKTQFIKLFRRITGTTPIAYRQKIRLEKAGKMLRTTEWSIQEVSAKAGFQDPLYFSRVFREKTGLSPSKYRKQNAVGKTNPDK
ncbi:MAG: AraC family transcriptional regulator [Clostridia bacterium]|nr:AraC family transcriptional regulator [Clostridia bacterium]